jgi:DNA helicase HerA-like ATPase
MMFKHDIVLQDINITNSTQRTVAVIGGKGAGKTTLLRQLMMQESPVLTFDPLSVVDGVDAHKINLKVKDIEPDRITVMMRAVNSTLKKDENVILSFNNMVQEEEIAIANLVLPKLVLRNGYVFFDEIHEYVPLFGQSKEVERYIRHCRNKNVGIVMTTQRPASVHKNVLALSDYVILFRVTWSHDLQAVRDLLKDAIPKDQVDSIIQSLPHLGFMEGYAIDYRSKEV